MRRMGVYSLVNTLCEYSREQIRVQILVDVDGSGKGSASPRRRDWTLGKRAAI